MAGEGGPLANLQLGLLSLSLIPLVTQLLWQLVSELVPRNASLMNYTPVVKLTSPGDLAYS